MVPHVLEDPGNPQATHANHSDHVVVRVKVPPVSPVLQVVLLDVIPKQPVELGVGGNINANHGPQIV